MLTFFGQFPTWPLWKSGGRFGSTSRPVACFSIVQEHVQCARWLGWKLIRHVVQVCKLSDSFSPICNGCSTSQLFQRRHSSRTHFSALSAALKATWWGQLLLFFWFLLCCFFLVFLWFILWWLSSPSSASVLVQFLVFFLLLLLF